MRAVWRGLMAECSAGQSDIIWVVLARRYACPRRCKQRLICSMTMALRLCRSVFTPKLASTAVIGDAASAFPVASTVLFSSAASLFGAPGQANYSAANAALEAWSWAAAVKGNPSTAVQWGAWAAGALRRPRV